MLLKYFYGIPNNFFKNFLTNIFKLINKILIFLHAFVQVVRELQYSKSGVTVKTEDGCVYETNYVILSVSIGVLQSDLLAFNPPLPVRLLFFVQLSLA